MALPAFADAPWSPSSGVSISHLDVRVLADCTPRCAARATLAGDLPAANQTLQTLVNQLQAAFGLREFGLCNECTHFCKNAVEAAKPADPVADSKGPHQCGLNKDALSDKDSHQICANFRS